MESTAKVKLEKQVECKARALRDTFNKMPKEMKSHGSDSLFLEVNKLLELAKEVLPGVDDRVWPGTVSPRSNYAELEAAVLTMINLLPGEIDGS